MPVLWWRSGSKFYKSTESWYVECALSKGACATIPCTCPFPTKEEAIEVWNRRVEE